MACEKCWGDAFVRHLNNPQKSQAEHYVDLLEERKHRPCTPEEEQGQFKTKLEAFNERQGNRVDFNGNYY